ncbi:MAG TPA: hypothetical protein VIF60_00360 [Burkholderiaceae bacterium]|jgi:hypothetical protein
MAQPRNNSCNLVGKVPCVPASNILVIDLADNACHAETAYAHTTPFSPMKGATRAPILYSRRSSACGAWRLYRHLSRFPAALFELPKGFVIHRILARRTIEPPAGEPSMPMPASAMCRKAGRNIMGA